MNGNWIYHRILHALPTLVHLPYRTPFSFWGLALIKTIISDIHCIYIEGDLKMAAIFTNTNIRRSHSETQISRKSVCSILLLTKRKSLSGATSFCNVAIVCAVKYFKIFYLSQVFYIFHTQLSPIRPNNTRNKLDRLNQRRKKTFGHIKKDDQRDGVSWVKSCKVGILT